MRINRAPAVLAATMLLTFGVGAANAAATGNGGHQKPKCEQRDCRPCPPPVVTCTVKGDCPIPQPPPYVEPPPDKPPVKAPPVVPSVTVTTPVTTVVNVNVPASAPKTVTKTVTKTAAKVVRVPVLVKAANPAPARVVKTPVFHSGI